jgi:hypothetical protein
MSPEDVKPEWVEKAARAVVDELGACAMCGESGPARCVYCKDDAEKHARAALAAVLPGAMAEAWAKGYAASDYEAYHVGTHGRTDNPYREGSES